MDDYSEKLEFMIKILELLQKSDYKITPNDIKNLFSKYIVPTIKPEFLTDSDKILLSPYIFLHSLKKILKLVKMEYLSDQIISYHKNVLDLKNLPIRKLTI